MNKNEVITAAYISCMNFLTGDVIDELFLDLPEFIQKENVENLINDKSENSFLRIAEKALGGLERNNQKGESLISIVTNVHVDGDTENKPLNLSKTIKDCYQWFFPCDEMNADEKKIIQDFLSASKNLKSVSELQFPVSFDALVENYFSNYFSGIEGSEDVSLWQYSRLKAAFAEAIYVCTINGIEPDANGELFNFVSGDASGIQSYIFNTQKAAYASKLFRARSFQVWIQSLQIALKIADKFGMSYLSVVSFSGGRFLLILPNLRESNSIIAAMRKEIDLYFINKYHGRFAFIVSDAVCRSADVVYYSGSELNLEINRNLNYYKCKRLQAGLSTTGYKLTSLYRKIREKGGVCDYCGECEADENQFGERICDNCLDMIEAGRKLAKIFDGKAHIITLYQDDYDYCLKNTIDTDGQNGLKFAVSSFIPGLGRLFLPYIVPISENGEVLTFEELEKKADGNNKLAMFKADVDYLGLVFGASLGKNWSFSRYAELSMRMHAFFSDGLRRIIQEKYNNKIYVVFSGGDDVCILGPWNIVLDFSKTFHDEFEKFTNKNPSLTLSAGISLFGSSFPVARVVEDAEEYLEKSKHYMENGKCKKNAMSIFNRTVSWEDFSRQLNYVQCYLLPLVKTEDENKKRFVYSLIDYSDRAWKLENGTEEEKQDVRNLLWQSHYAYKLGRLKDKIVNEEKEGEMNSFFKSLKGNPKEMKNIRIAATIAIYKNRSNKEEKDVK